MMWARLKEGAEYDPWFLPGKEYLVGYGHNPEGPDYVTVAEESGVPVWFTEARFEE